MDRRTDNLELLAAWRALDDTEGREGWRTIPIAAESSCELRAGRHSPGNFEALIVGFANCGTKLGDQLPQGRGFVVSEVNLGLAAPGTVCVGLVRQLDGPLDMFAMMATDIIEALCALGSADADRLLHAFLTRVRAWQYFMQKGDRILSADAEVGIFGELCILRALRLSGLSSEECLNAWTGPTHGLHDFTFRGGAIEVKATIAKLGFPAKVGGLEQLDDSLVQPLFLAAVRLNLTTTGLTLPEFAVLIAGEIADDPGALAAYGTRLVQAGLALAQSARYTRRFASVGTRYLSVAEGFPRLVRGSVPLEILWARYELDLDLVRQDDRALADVLQEIGVG